MKKLLNKLFFQKLGIFNLSAAAFGFIFGLVVVMISINFYVKFDRLKSKNKNYLVVNKKPHPLYVKFPDKAGFSPEEIKEIAEQDFVNNVSGLYGTKFKIWLELDKIDLKSLFMYESIEDTSFYDTPLGDNWAKFDMENFNPQTDFVPVVISQDLLNMYNYVFSKSNNSVQFTNESIKTIRFDMKIWGPNHKEKEIYHAQVVGFTDRYTSILIPHEFIKFGNKRYCGVDTDIASRIVIETKADSKVDPEKYCEDQNFLVNKDEMKTLKVINALNIIVWVLAIFGFMFVFYSIVIVNLVNTLIITKVKDEIHLLLQQGFSVSLIVRFLTQYLVKFLAVLSIVSVGFYLLLNMVTINYVVDYFPNIQDSYVLWVWLAFAIFVATSFMICYVSIKKAMKQYN